MWEKGEEEEWKEVTKGKVEGKKPRRASGGFYKNLFQEKNSAATPLVSIKGRRDEERAMIHAVNSSESS